jgi:hypothetical protein
LIFVGQSNRSRLQLNLLTVVRGVRSLIDLPGDEDGGMFGLRRALEPPLMPPEKLARVLL